MKNNSTDDFDLPDDVPPDPVLQSVPESQVTVIAQDLRLGPAEVKPYDRTAWIREFGPKPPSAGMRIMDFVIVGLLFCTALVIVQALAWAIFS